MTDREKTQEIKEASKDAFKILDVEQEAQKTYSVSTANPINSENYIEKLKLLQEELQKEVKKNPKIQLTDEYRKVQERYEQIVNPKTNIELGIEEDKNKEEIITTEQENIDNSVNKLQETDDKLVDDENSSNVISDKQEEKVNENPIDMTQEESLINAISEISSEEEKENSNNIMQEENIKEEEPQQSEIENTVNDDQNEIEKNMPEDNKIMQEETTNLENEGEKSLSFEEMYRQLFGKEPYGGRKQPEKEKNYYTIDTDMEDSNMTMFEDDTEYRKLQYKFIGIAFNTYIILEIENELYIMDQHAAHERIMYEKVKKNFYDENERSSQLLLLPDIIELSSKEMAIAKDNFNLFRQAGFTLEEFGENTIKLSGVPEICIDLNTRDLFKETLDEINTVARTAKQEKEEKFIATVACKAAVKANMKLEKEEVEKLMEKLLELPNPFTCPHGRPTVIKMSKYEIERKFARK